MREILIAGGLALFFSLFGTPLLIKALVRKGYGQVIRDDGPSSHHTKRGTPTMGGIIIIFSVIASYLIAHLISGNTISTSAVLILGLVFAIGLLGFLWSLRSGQYDDLDGAGWRAIADDEPAVPSASHPQQLK